MEANMKKLFVLSLAVLMGSVGGVNMSAAAERMSYQEAFLFCPGIGLVADNDSSGELDRDETFTALNFTHQTTQEDHRTWDVNSSGGLDATEFLVACVIVSID
jgi:hypothetical protein